LALGNKRQQTSHKTPQAEPPRTAIRTDALDVANAAAHGRVNKAKVIASHGVPPFMLLALPICVFPAHINVNKSAVFANAAFEYALLTHLREDFVQGRGRAGKV
jgi:hypothetical protein